MPQHAVSGGLDGHKGLFDSSQGLIETGRNPRGGQPGEMKYPRRRSCHQSQDAVSRKPFPRILHTQSTKAFIESRPGQNRCRFQSIPGISHGLDFLDHGIIGGIEFFMEHGADGVLLLWLL